MDHVSAYALIVEDGTALARRVARGELPAPDDDVAAARYEMIDDVLSAAGFSWYEVSNWASGAGAAVPAQPRVLARRRLVGRGPGRALAPGRRAVVERQAPGAVRRAAGRGSSPEAGREELTDAERATERVMLRLRLASGLALSLLDSAGRAAAARAASDGLLDPGAR